MSRREYLAEAREAHRYEKQDPTPVELPAGLERPLSIQEEIRRHLAEFMALGRAQEEAGGEETFEEFNDLEEEDPEPEPDTPYIAMEPDEGGEPSYRLEGDAPEQNSGDSIPPEREPTAGSAPTPPDESSPDSSS